MTITADFSGGEKTATTEPLYQWDTGQKLALSGLPQTASDIQVHFANAAMPQAIVKATATENSLPTCDIPNEFLQFGSAAKARAWVYYKEGSSKGYTIKTVLIPITPRKRPNDYVSPEDPDSQGIVDRAIELLEGYEDDLASKLDASAGAVGTENLADESITVEKVADDLAAVINGKEVKSNKKTTLTGNESSDDFYPTTKAVHDAIENLDAIPYSVKLAMDTLFSKAAYADDDAASSYATFHAWAISNPVTLAAVFTQGSATIYDTDSLDTLKQYLTVTATYSDGTTATVSSADYTLSGTLEVGTSTIVVSYGGKTATFNVTVTLGAWDYEWYASSGTVPPSMSVAGTPTFAPDNEYMEVILKASQVLDFNHVGAARIVAVLATTSGTYWSNPQFVIETAENTGAKLFIETVNQNSRIFASCSGTNTEVYNPTVGDFHKYDMICDVGDCKLYIDGALSDSGIGKTNDQYITFTGIQSTSDNRAPVRLKSLKYKAL